MANPDTNQVSKIVTEVKQGFKTTEFYLSSFVTLVGTLIQFLPASKADALVKAAGLVSAVLSALGYTYSRTTIKTNA